MQQNGIIIIIFNIIIIERRDFGGIMSDDCKDTLQTQNKTVQVQRWVTGVIDGLTWWRQHYPSWLEGL